MKRIFLLTFVLFVCGYAKEIKISFVDSERIFKEYQAIAAADAEFNGFVDKCRDSVEILKKDVETLKAELEAQKLVLSEEARLRKLDEIEAATSTYNRFLEEYFGEDGKVEQKNDELMTPILKTINDAVAKVAQQEGFSMTLELSDGIFYASSELDLTDLVIKELNLEYGPQAVPSGAVQKVIAIFPFREENLEATGADLGQRCQDLLYDVIGAYSQKFEIEHRAAVSQEIESRQFNKRNLTDDQAMSIGHALTCDYIITGSVSKFATKIDYTISLKNVLDGTETDRKTNSVTEDIKLKEYLHSDLVALLEKIQ